MRILGLFFYMELLIQSLSAIFIHSVNQHDDTAFPPLFDRACVFFDE